MWWTSTFWLSENGGSVFNYALLLGGRILVALVYVMTDVS
jgi:hypothetical protein